VPIRLQVALALWAGALGAVQEKPRSSQSPLERWREAPSEVVSVLVDARLAPRQARADFLRIAGPDLGTASLRAALGRLQALNDSAADRWSLEILHHLPPGHDLRLRAPLESITFFRPVAPVRLVESLAVSRDDNDAGLLRTLLGLLPAWSKTPELSSRLWKLASGTGRRSDHRLFAVRALLGDTGKETQLKALKLYTTEESSRLRAALLDLIDPKVSPRALGIVTQRLEALSRLETQETRAYLSLGRRAQNDEGLAVLRNGAIYARRAPERAFAVNLLASYTAHPRFLDVVREVRDLQVNDADLRRQMRTALIELASGSVEDRALELIEDAMADRDPGVRLAAAYALRKFPGDRSTPLFLRLLKDKAPQVVSSAIWGLFFTGRADALDLIASQLEPAAGASRALLADALRALSLATGQDFKDAGAWEAWRKEHTRLPDGYALPKPSAGARTVVKGFFAHTITSQHPAFVLDVSGSMDATEGFLTRREVLHAELASALRSLNATVTFSLIAFSGEAVVWPKGPAPATAENVEDALRFLRARKGANGTNFHEALKAALGTADCDTVYFLSDGMPNEGEVRAPGELAEWLRTANASRGLIINTIGIGESNDLLLRLAVENQGVYKPMLAHGPTGG